MKELLIHGERFILHHNRALIWPEQRILVAADLRLGMAEPFIYSDVDQSPQEQWDKLLQLEDICNQFEINHVMFLGDIVHSRHGLTEQIVSDLSDFLLRVDTQTTLIPSQQDRASLKLWNALFPKIEVLFQWQIERFIFQHRPPPAMMDPYNDFYWCGHISPTAHGKPCFVVDEQLGLLPAYSERHGGQPIRVESHKHVFICDTDRILEA